MEKTLSEFINRRGRVKIVKLILNNGWSIQELANELEVSRQAIYLWLDPEETHPRNSNLEKLLIIAATVDQSKTLEIFRDELGEFQLLLNEFCVGTIIK